MGPATKKHNKGRAADRPRATPKPQSSHMVVPPTESPNIPQELQQLILNVFREALTVSADSDLKQIIQNVKAHLYNRDFVSAFGTEQFLHAYAARWSASRALAYAAIFTEQGGKNQWLQGQSTTAENKPQDVSSVQVLCIGAGAGAEVVALAAIAKRISLPHLSITVVDIADWSTVLSKLTTAVSKPPALSQYASAAKRDANRALLDPSSYHVDFRRQDILGYSSDELGLLVADVTLVTIMFTLNELFSTSVAKTTAFLLKLTDFMKPGSWLLVVDSPGSYSEVTLGKVNEPKQYPMQWLLDHILQQMAGHEASGISKWRNHVTDTSRWFRVNELNYPLELESMRYQIHVYQRQPKDDKPGQVDEKPTSDKESALPK